MFINFFCTVQFLYTVPPAPLRLKSIGYSKPFSNMSFHCHSHDSLVAYTHTGVTYSVWICLYSYCIFKYSGQVSKNIFQSCCPYLPLHRFTGCTGVFGKSEATWCSDGHPCCTLRGTKKNRVSSGASLERIGPSTVFSIGFSDAIGTPPFFSRSLIIGLDVWDFSFWNILCVVSILLNAWYLLYRVSAIICRELGDRWGEEEHAEFLHMSKVYQPFVDATDRESMWVSLPKPTYLHYVNPFGPRLCFCYKPSSLRNWYFYPYFLPHINSTLPRLFRGFIHCLKTAEKNTICKSCSHREPWGLQQWTWHSDPFPLGTLQEAERLPRFWSWKLELFHK